MDARETPLIEAFVRLADTLVDDFDVVELAQQLVENSVVLLPGIDAAGLLLIDTGGKLEVLASTSEQTHLLELLQLQAQSGPCLSAVRSGEPVIVRDLGKDDRWPDFAEHALQRDFRTLGAVPLRLRSERLGALNLFGAGVDALSRQDLDVAQALADVATIGILQARLIARSDLVNQQLQIALQSRIIIEQAKGVLAERGQLDMTRAFALLRSHARDTNQRLVDLARRVVEGTADSAAILDN